MISPPRASVQHQNHKNNEKIKKSSTNRNSRLHSQFLLFITLIIISFILIQIKLSSVATNTTTTITDYIGNNNDKNNGLITGGIRMATTTSSFSKKYSSNGNTEMQNLLKEQQQQPNNKYARKRQEDKETTTPQYHLIFSTDCSEYQRWQSYLFFYNAYKIKQPSASITRIVSGCDSSAKAKEEEWHKKYIQHSLNDNYYIHFTPKFSSDVIEGKKYDFFNKPFGVLHYLEYFLHYDGSSTQNSSNNGAVKWNQEDIIFLFDPDQILLRPITHAFSKDDLVRSGKPYAQRYGYGSLWIQKIRSDIPSLFYNSTVSSTASSLYSIKESEAGPSYAVGPPYMATIQDMYNITKLWCLFVPRVYKLHPHLLAEMFAYSASAAHLNLPHTVKTSFMVSDIAMSLEAWGDYLDHVKEDTLCEDVISSSKSVNLPYVWHYCQRYMIGKHFFGKKRIPTPFFQCSTPYFTMPPANVSLLYDYRIPPPPHKPQGQMISMRKKEAKRNAIGVCVMTRSLNDALEFFKTKHCRHEDIHMDHSYDLWEGHG